MAPNDRGNPASLTATAARAAGGVDLSVIVPFYNEEDNVEPLYARLTESVTALGLSYELLFVNDGSGDATEQRLRDLAADDQRVVVINLVRNQGQTAAMMAGIDHARGAILVTMDGDGQNDPADIAAMLERLDEGFDVVSGWRKDRKDRALSRKLPSMIANWLISKVSGVHLHDYGCSLKAYRASVIKNVRLYGEMHRFIPIYTVWQGGRVSEMPVRHHPRTSGTSSYGLERIFKVLLDLTLVMFLERYVTKPIYVFGGMGLFFFAASFVAGSWAVWLKLFAETSFIQTPLPVLVAMCFTTGVICMLMGLLAELLTRAYYEIQDRRIYQIRDIVNDDRE